MPRQARLDSPRLLQHVMCRGIERRKIFLNDRDRKYFLGRFSKILVKTGTTCLAWSLLDNHFQKVRLFLANNRPVTVAVRQMGYAGVEVAKQLHVAQAAVVVSTRRGEDMVNTQKY